MRNTIAATAIAMLASSGSAFAADCTKGLLWPYVRNPGDCLTEQELKTGVYQGAPQGPVDVGNIKSPEQPAMPITTQDCHETGIWPFRSEECTTVVKPGATNSPPPAPQPAVSASTPATPAPVAQSAPPAVRPQAAAPAPVAGQCNKGVLWPFVRDPGDCPTATERASGVTAVPGPTSAPAAATPAAMPITAQDCHETGIWPFRSEECTPVAKTSATNSPPAPQPAVSANTPAAPTPVAQSAPPAVRPQAAAPAPVAQQCNKGVLWPFVRDPGDCPTATERASGVTAVPGPTAAATPAAMPAVVTQTSAAPAAASCGKSWLWPFVRDDGDCRTAVEKASGATDPVPVRASAPAETAPAAMPAVVRQTDSAPAAAPAAPATASCSKGLLWPFVRDPGDCPTSADKGQTRSGGS
jgi:nicotinate-nucleotide--dimethylbenzimidazole phosphoribosyltransferase